MSRCQVKGCRYKANVDFCTSKITGKFETFSLCWSHGMTSSRKELLTSIVAERKLSKPKAIAIGKHTPIPHNVDKDELTLENYLEVTGKRFRKTKDQVDRGLSRSEAFLEMMGKN